MDLNLPAAVKSLAGASVAGTPIIVQFAIVNSIGAGGGTISTAGGASLTVPAGGVMARAEADSVNYEISPTRVFSAPTDLMSADGLAYLFTPECSHFWRPGDSHLAGARSA